MIRETSVQYQVTGSASRRLVIRGKTPAASAVPLSLFLNDAAHIPGRTEAGDFFNSGKIVFASSSGIFVDMANTAMKK